MFQKEFLVTYLGKLQAEDCLICLKEMVKHNRQNVPIVVQVASSNSEKLGVAPVVELLQEAGAYDGIFFYLQALLPKTQDHQIYFKFIESAVKCNRMDELEKVIKEAPQCYDPKQVLDFFLENRLASPTPLVILCDQNGFTEQLTRYLWTNNLRKHINFYLMQINSNAAPSVLSTLVDLEADEVYIKQLLYNLGGNCPPEQLIEEFTQRNKLRVLETWLDLRAQEGNTNTAIHNALARILISTDKDPLKFIQTNQYYDSKVVGAYCEDNDPHMAYECYKRDAGNCDYQLVELTNKNALYRLQAKYLVERQDKELWAHVLAPDNPHRQFIVEQVVSSALPDSDNINEITCTIKAFTETGLDK